MIISPDLKSFILTAIIGCLGALVAFMIGLPAPFLCGPAIAVTAAGLGGLRLSVPKSLRNATFVVVGISMGTSVTPDVIDAAKTWPLSFLAVLVTVVILLYVAYWILHHGFGYDRNTAMLAASPGHLSYIISLTAETKSDLASVSVIQSVRVLALTLAVPLLVEYLDLVSIDPIVLISPMPPLVLGLTILGSLAVGWIFMRWRFPAALLLGGVAVSIFIHITGLASGGVPNWLSQPTYIVLGSLIGTRFSRASLRDMRKAFLAGGVVTVAVVLLASIVALLVSRLTGVPINAVMIAFAPGGLETMAAMAVMMHADTAYVGSHHVLRLLFLSVLMPWVLRKKPTA
ncbi:MULTISPECIES: AbrB family transcriptional regulator [unclassified Rhizobium]|uniref:AbrB family transcriptional regulator n=1 Tax=unclassified Rhizobium TaxID=2613769 RepID=UPI00178476CD|nr:MULTISPECIES: AbrB family transcriptional regulator [unclassified Rhizobium]MBD8686207.1 AbrB family transcriptional regulator [Rhizobium sp. CFBP 13644]MBD8690120.1 AbrB family transcriptional regulator [Rhizobium sp. CFBP 13717]